MTWAIIKLFGALIGVIIFGVFVFMVVIAGGVKEALDQLFPRRKNK